MTRIMITGSCGFIFSNFIIYALQKTDWDLVSIDKLTYAGSLLNVPQVKRHKLYMGDVCDRHFVENVFKIEQPDVVIHGAAESVSQNTIIPYMASKKIEHIEICDLWDRFKKRNDIITNENGVQLMNINGEQSRALTWKNGFGQWRKIKQISRHRYNGKMIHMRQKWGEIDVTPNHSIYNSDMELVKPSKDQELLSLRSIKRSHSEKSTINKFGNFDWKLSIDDYLYMVAFYITEGCASYNKSNGGYIVDFSQNDMKDIKRISQILKDNFDDISVYIGKSTSECNYARITNKEIHKTFIKICGQYSSGKFMPHEIFKLKDELQKKFIEYMVYFDGHKYTDTNKKYGTNSRKLAAQLSTLFSLVKQDYSYSRKIHENDKWKDNYLFQLSNIYNELNSSIYEEYEYNGWVYDLEIDDTHKFVCGLGNVIVHNTHVDNSIDDASQFLKTNIIGSQTVFDACLKNNIKKIIQVSTDEVYGSLETGSADENYPLNPQNPYAVSKAAADQLGRAYLNTHNLPVITVRPSNNLGPRQHIEKFIPKVITNILTNKKIPLYGTGENKREWLYVGDHFDALKLIVEVGQIGETYNIGSGNERSNLEVLNTIFEVMGGGSELVEFVKDRPGHDLRYSIDSSKLRSLGWAPKYEFEDSIFHTCSWFKSNSWSWKHK